MKKFIVVAAASLAFSTTAMANEPVELEAEAGATECIELTADDMDMVSAGVLDNLRLGAVIPVAAILANAGTSASIGLLSENVLSQANAEATAFNMTSLNLGDWFN